MARASLPTLLIGLLVVFILLAYMCTFQVSFYQAAVKVRLGRADESSVIREPGIRFMWPLIDSVEIYDTRLQTLDTPETEFKTRDGKNLIVGAYALWRIKDPLLFYKQVRKQEEAERQMRPRLSQSQAAVIGESTLADFVQLDPALVEASRERMLSAIQQREAPGLLQDYGVELVRIGLRRISLPKETTQQVFESMRQERNRLAAGYRQEGKSKAEGIRSRAESQANAILSFANSRAQQIKSAGIAAGARIMQQIPPEDTNFYVFLRMIEAIKASLSQKTTIFIDEQHPFFDTFVRPPQAADGAAGAVPAPRPAGSAGATK